MGVIMRASLVALVLVLSTETATPSEHVRKHHSAGFGVVHKEFHMPQHAVPQEYVLYVLRASLSPTCMAHLAGDHSYASTTAHRLHPRHTIRTPSGLESTWALHVNEQPA